MTGSVYTCALAGGERHEGVALCDLLGALKAIWPEAYFRGDGLSLDASGRDGLARGLIRGEGRPLRDDAGRGCLVSAGYIEFLVSLPSGASVEVDAPDGTLRVGAEIGRS